MSAPARNVGAGEKCRASEKMGAGKLPRHRRKMSAPAWDFGAGEN